MPLIKSASKKATENNFDEVRHGKMYAKTRRKFGEKAARKQMIARVLENKRKAAGKKKVKHHRKRVAAKR
jgi:hypothetical protein